MCTTGRLWARLQRLGLKSRQDALGCFAELYGVMQLREFPRRLHDVGPPQNQRGRHRDRPLSRLCPKDVQVHHLIPNLPTYLANLLFYRFLKPYKVKYYNISLFTRSRNPFPSGPATLSARCHRSPTAAHQYGA